MWIALGALLLVVWGAAFLVFRVASAAIHLLVIGAVVFGVVHLIEKRRHAAGDLKV